MTSLRLLFAALLASTTLTSCGAFVHADSREPTVSQQDAYDVSWGLPARKTRGNPKLKYQYNARNEISQPMPAAPAAPAAPVAAPAPAPAPNRAPISPTIPSTLR
ncbi:MAG: hypothetical protein ACKVY0_24905 [Prosthecobacter sp.]|uniref:hypothetical protein n=1 Tax=Prosthecobacter sp. TaxID=1965333 RepID=UPI0038FD6883